MSVEIGKVEYNHFQAVFDNSNFLSFTVKNSLTSSATPPMVCLPKHSTLPTQSTGEGSDALSVYISAGVSGAVVVLVAAAVTVISVSVCLRKRKNKHVNTTDNVAYHCSGGPETIKINEAYAEISDPSITTSTNDAYGITRGACDVTTSQNEAYAVTDGGCQSSGSGMRMKINEAYTNMSTAMNRVSSRNVG